MVHSNEFLQMAINAIGRPLLWTVAVVIGGRFDELSQHHK